MDAVRSGVFFLNPSELQTHYVPSPEEPREGPVASCRDTLVLVPPGGDHAGSRWPAALQLSQEQDISLLQGPVRGRPRAPFGVSDGEPKKARGWRRTRVHLVTHESKDQKNDVE